jgi:hypothetical protein
MGEQANRRTGPAGERATEVVRKYCAADAQATLKKLRPQRPVSKEFDQILDGKEQAWNGR